jgi:hypothetical protein
LVAIGAVSLMLAGLIVAERAVLVNGPSYPRWLATGEVPSASDEAVAMLHGSACRGQGPVEVHLKPQGVVLRCGTWFLPATKTFLAPLPKDSSRVRND